jgi:uncharacterized protein YlxW (UPF0749 family)
LKENNMNSFQPFPIHHLSGSPGSSNAVEMLQTDVMRFFAILCLCLMAIFALVKALPLSQSEQPTIAEPADLKKEVQSLQIQITALKKKLADIKTRTQSALMEAEQSALQARKAAEDEQMILDRLSATRQRLRKATLSLDQTRSRLELRENKLAGLAHEINQKQHMRAELKAQITDETQKLNHMQRSLNRTEENVLERQTRQAPAPRPPTPPLKTTEKEGHVLRFASDAALRTLISTGDVKFYAVAGQRAWQLRRNGSRPDFIPSQYPRQIYEMEPTTVPVEYAAAFKQQVAAFGRSSVTWGVTLPPQTADSIRQLVKGNQKGELVILQNGKVVLK